MAIDLVRRTDDLSQELDTREQRAVAVLTAAGLLPGTYRPTGQVGRRTSGGNLRPVRTA